MFDKILIANRGEIALRIIRACRELGVGTVMVHSEADSESLPVKFADETVCIGSPSPLSSYLLIDRIISAAEVTDVGAIHPGYGFLAENAHFADVCKSCNIKFIGPSSEAIRTLGDKATARKTMMAAKVPVTPGSKDIIKNEKEAKETAKKLGYPVIIKASAGGGGRGMRIAHNNASLIQGFHAARTEAENAFNNSDVYIEKYIINPKHIEFQIMADEHGHVVHLGERDCSIQRRHQKLIEETPSPAVDAKLRREMGDAAVRAAKAAKYQNAGTIEFLLGADKSFYFMEMNTRIQVEHPITEEVTGTDLIKEQIKVAAGKKLSFTQKKIKMNGHSIECRINAEDTKNNFAPSPGKINGYIPPGGPGIRMDSHIFSGYTIPPYYDSMLGKLIIHASTRNEAIEKAICALDETVIEGIKTSIPFTEYILNSEKFLSGDYNTGYVEELLKTEYIN